jgi:hypothetical protein
MGFKVSNYASPSQPATAFNIASYTPPGPVAAAYIRDDTATVAALMGPVGSGKTHATIFKALRFTAMMPVCRDGVIRAKGAVVRDSYRTLYATTLASWFMWFPKDYPGSRFIGGDDRPATHELAFSTMRGRRIELTVEFKALGLHRIEDIMRGWEGTWAWANEMDLLDRSAVRFLVQRTGRYPARGWMEHDVSPPAQVFGDMNPPEVDTWVEEDFSTAPVEGYALHRQPGGRSPDAENVANLREGYYDRMAMGQPHWYVRRFVDAQFGYSRDGLPVYTDFDERRHIAPHILRPAPGLPIVLGFDAGLHPAGVICQPMPDGQWRVLEELYWGRMGPGRFAELTRLALESRYRENDIQVAAADPSALYGADKEGGELSWLDIVSRALGLHLTPAPSNEPDLRLEAVRSMLTYAIAPEVPGIWVSPVCKTLIKGFASHYRLKVDQHGKPVGGEAARPEKNEYSNLHDALQYAALTARGRAGIISAAARLRRPGQARGAGGASTVIKSEFAL